MVTAQAACLKSVIELGRFSGQIKFQCRGGAGYPEGYAQVNLGHNSKAMTRAYSRKAEVEMPSLSEYERQQKAITKVQETHPPPWLTLSLHGVLQWLDCL